MLAGRYPSDEFAELGRASSGTARPASSRPREGARRLAVTNAGTIPDRGLFGVFIVDGGEPRVGELDEEMVYEARAGSVIMLGASSWRIEEITRDRVLVSPAPGVPGKMPFWKGEARAAPRARPRDRQVLRASSSLPKPTTSRAPPRQHGLDESRRRTSSRTCASRRGDRWCRVDRTSWSSGSATRSATGASASSRRSARACTRRGRWRSARACASARRSSRVDLVGRRHRLPSARRRTRRPRSTLFAAHRRGDRGARAGRARQHRRSSPRASARTPAARCCSRADPGERTPLWAAAAEGSAVCCRSRASTRASRSCSRRTASACSDVFDLPALSRAAQGCARESSDLSSVESRVGRHRSRRRCSSPTSATSSTTDDTPLGRTARAGALVDRDQLRELLGAGGAARADRCRRARGGRGVSSAAARASPIELHDVLRRRGDLRAGEFDEAHAAILETERRALRMRFAGDERLIAAEDAGRYRDALGVHAAGRACPTRSSRAAPSRCASSCSATRAAAARSRLREAERALRASTLEPALRELERARQARPRRAPAPAAPSASGDPDVLCRLRRASLAALRREALEPAERAASGGSCRPGTVSIAGQRSARPWCRSRPSRCTSMIVSPSWPFRSAAVPSAIDADRRR